MFDVEEEVFGAKHDEGAYECTLKSVERVESEKDPGQFFRVWTFNVTDDGSELSGTSSMLMTPKSKAYQWATALVGGKSPSGATVSALLGRKVVVEIDDDEKITALHPILKAKRATVETFDDDYDPR